MTFRLVVHVTAACPMMGQIEIGTPSPDCRLILNPAVLQYFGSADLVPDRRNGRSADISANLCNHDWASMTTRVGVGGGETPVRWPLTGVYMSRPVASILVDARDLMQRGCPHGPWTSCGSSSPAYRDLRTSPVAIGGGEGLVRPASSLDRGGPPQHSHSNNTYQDHRWHRYRRRGPCPTGDFYGWG